MDVLPKMILLFLLIALANGQGADDAGDIRIPPSIVMNAKREYVLAKKQKLQMSCVAKGFPPPKVKWYRNNVNYPMATDQYRQLHDGTLTVTDFERSDYGQFQCKAENKYGLVVSNYVEVKKAAFDTDFVPTPETVQAKEGEPFALRCRINGPVNSFPPPRWLWIIQNTLDESLSPVQREIKMTADISSDKDGTLHFSRVKMSDAKEFYLCGAWNSHDGINSRRYGSAYRLNVQSNPGAALTPPEITYTNPTAEASKLKVVEDDNLELFCLFSGGDLTIEWFKEGVKVSPGALGGGSSRILSHGNTMLRLQLVKNTADFNGEYTCRATNPQGVKEYTYEVIVLERPRFTKQPKMVRNVNITQGGEVEFVCEATGKPEPTIQWLINDKPYNDPSVPSADKRAVSGNTYKMENLDRDTDIHVVTCKAQNQDRTIDVGTSFISGYINVIVPLTFTAQPEDFEIKSMDEEFTLKCNVHADPSKRNELKVHWYHDGVLIDPKAEDYARTILPNFDLLVKAKKFADQDKKVGDITGIYECLIMQTSPNVNLTASSNVTASPDVIPAAVTTAAISLWWIAIIVAILLIIIIIILICCCIKRNRGESYPVDEVERKMGNDPEKDLKDSGFHDYQRPEKDPIGGSRASLSGSIKPLDSDDDDNDSMAEYGDIDTGKFNEDGSFIGQYGQDRGRGGPPPYSKTADSAV